MFCVCLSGRFSIRFCSVVYHFAQFIDSDADGGDGGGVVMQDLLLKRNADTVTE